MSFDVHPILEPGQRPARSVWYALSVEGGQPASKDAEATVSGPSPRVGSNANYFQDGGHVGKVLITGGATPDGPFSEVHQLSMRKDNMEWDSVSADGLPPRYEHATFITHSPDGHGSISLYMFGGAKPDGSVNDVWKLNLGDPETVCTEVKVSGSIPIPRTYHSSSSFVVERGELLVCGGGSTGLAPVTERKVYVFNQKTGEWSTPATSGSPPPTRQGHVAAVVGSKLFIHGGMVGLEILSDLYCLDLGTLDWSCPKVGGAAPPPLAAHGCAVIGASIYMFGGLSPANPGTRTQDTLYCLDTDLLMWQKVSVSGTPPPARLDHAMCAIKIPVSSAATSNGQGPLEQADFDERQATIGACKSKTMKKDNSISCTSFQAVTIIDPEVATASSLETVSEQMEELKVKETNEASSEDQGPMAGDSGVSGGGEIGTDEWVSALFVFGGMDTLGNVHGDSFILVP